MTTTSLTSSYRGRIHLVFSLIMLVVLLVSTAGHACVETHGDDATSIHCCDSSGDPAGDTDHNQETCPGCICACHAPIVPAATVLSVAIAKTDCTFWYDFICRFPEVYIPLFIPPDIA